MAAKKQPAKQTAVTTKKLSAIDFTRAFVRKKPKAEFKEVRAAAQKKGLKLYPIVYGRAKALEGLVRSSFRLHHQHVDKPVRRLRLESQEELAGCRSLDAEVYPGYQRLRPAENVMHPSSVMLTRVQ